MSSLAASLPGHEASIAEAAVTQPSIDSGPAVMTEAPLLNARISAGYGGTETLHDVALHVLPGERLGVVGSSGAGKSTLAMAAMGLLPWRGGWAKGTVQFGGRNLLSLREREWRAIRGKSVALVPQSPASALNPALTLLKHFEEAWRAHEVPAAGVLRTHVEALLQRVDLPADRDFLNRKPGGISIGQAQRLLIALALLHRPKLLIADEPTSALDVCNQAETLRLLDELSREQGMAMLYVSHDLVSVVQMCDRMLVLSDGKAVQTLHCDDLDGATAHHPATERLLRTLPAPAAVLRRAAG
ncbi:MAG: ATP-binding cassette domain-containing protein [Janthinobacterium lividum]